MLILNVREINLGLTNAHKGYNYQDLLTSYFMLEEILSGNDDSIFHIDKKHTPNGIVDRFDDLVIKNKNGIQRKQIKYSDDATKKVLSKDDLSSDSNYKIALHKLYETWKTLNTQNSEFRLCLAWDKPINKNITKVLDPLPSSHSSFYDFSTQLYKINLDKLWELNPEKFNRWDSLKRYVDDYNINRSDFKKFCDELIIELELPKASSDFSKPLDLEKILFQQTVKIGIGLYPNDKVNPIDFLERLAKKVGEYRSSSSTVTVTQILKDLRVKTDFGNIEQKFELDQSKNIKGENKVNDFYKKVLKNKKTLLIGEPGAGKSWFLTNFIEYLEKNDKSVIRHYCFTSTEDEFQEERISSNVFVGNLVADIIDTYPFLKAEKDKLFVSDIDELNLLLSKIKDELIIVIDGLDHIDRVLKSSSTISENKTKIIDFISQIDLPENIYIVLGSQPVIEIQTLINNHLYVELDLPKWNLEDTKKLMKKFSLKDKKLKQKKLSKYLFKKSEGSPLYLTYIIHTLMNKGKVTLKTIRKLPKYDFNLRNYYEYLSSQIKQNLTAEALACLEFSVTKDELKEIIPRSGYLDDNLKVLSPVISDKYSRGGIKLYHDSFRRFIFEKHDKTTINEVYNDISNWLEKLNFYESPKAYRYLLKYYLKQKRYDDIKQYATNEFLTNSLYHGYSETTIRINYFNFLYTAKETLDWSLYIYLSELNRTIYMTISEEYNSDFLENFELYFEAVGQIYGFKKANEILFFDGKKNFNNEIIAKGFYISQKNGVIPDWRLISDYFKNKIPLDDYKYYLSSLIAQDVNLLKEFQVLLKKKYKEFFKIFIIELYEQIGFRQILKLYKKLKIKKKDTLAKRINFILERTNCDRRIIYKNIKAHIVLNELKLDFDKGYLDEKKLQNFYIIVKQYAHYNPKALEQFENTIKSKNFFHNWIKFLIRNFLIEEKLLNSEFKRYIDLEDMVIKNFEFLASDVDQFKGSPRIVDFTHQNSELIDLTIEQGLKFIKSKRAWKRVTKLLDVIPYNTMKILKSRFINSYNLYEVINSYEAYDMTDNANYHEHLEYSLNKAIFYSKNKMNANAKSQLRKASHLFTGYTFHKDRTLEEIINPLPSINALDHNNALLYAKKLKYLTDAVIKHTDDNKGTRWLTTEWFHELLKIDYNLACIYLVDQFINNEYYWKLEYMLSDYIQKSSQLVNPVLLNFLYRLSPTTVQDKYINSYVDNIHSLTKTHRYLSTQSLIHILERDLNNSYDSLSAKTTEKIKVLKNLLNVDIPIKKKRDDNKLTNYKGTLIEQLNNSLGVEKKFLSDMTFDDIKKDLDNYKSSVAQDFNSMYYYMLQINDEQLLFELFLKLIKKQYAKTPEEYYENLRHLIHLLDLTEELKVEILINIFTNSKDRWYSMFIQKEALKDAVELNKELSLYILSKNLHSLFSSLGYGTGSTSNLIIAFEYAGVEKDEVLSMYKRGFEFIEYRLPDDNNFDWEKIVDVSLLTMGPDELAIVVILSKLKNYDSNIQKEVLYSINYLLLNNFEPLLIKPIQWFLKNNKYFPHLSIASILEVFLLHIDTKRDFFIAIKDDINKAENLKNAYINSRIDLIIKSIENV